METVQPLPAREPLLPGEALASLIRRTAGAMNYKGPGTIRTLLKESGDVPAHLNHLRAGRVSKRLGRLMRQSRAAILDATVHRYSSNLMLVAKTAPAVLWCDSKTILKHFQSAHPPI